MKCSLRSVFKKVCDFLIGDPPENSIKMEEFYAIKDMMRERGCNLEFFYLGTLRSDTVFDMGIIVDDTNNTKLGDLIKSKNLVVKYLHRENSRGRGSAVLHGLKKALDENKFDIFIEMDADFSHNPNELKKNLDKFEKNELDLLIASRYHEKSEIINSALAHLYGSLGYLYAEKGDYASMLNSIDESFNSLSKLKILDVQSVVETTLIPYWYEFPNKQINYDLLYSTYLEYLDEVGGAKSSTYLWAISDYLYYLKAPIDKKVDISESLVDKMRDCSKGYDLAWMLAQKSLLEYEKGDLNSSLKTAKESLKEYVYGNGWMNDETARVLGLIANIQIDKNQYKNLNLLITIIITAFLV